MQRDRYPFQFPHPWRGWALFLLALCGMLAIAAVDRRMKAAESPGFVPGDTHWALYTPSMPQVWGWLQNAPEWSGLREAFPATLLNPSLEIRKATGIRPTPTRWQHWLGKSYLAFGKGTDWGAVVRPGMLIRAAHVILGRAAPGGNGLFFWNGYFYGWRDGYLVFSPDRNTVSDALSGVAYQSETAGSTTPFIEVQFRRGVAGRLTVYCAPGVPVAGTVARAFPAGAANFVPHYVWQDPPLAYLAGASLGQLEALRLFAAEVIETMAPVSSVAPGETPALFRALYEAYATAAAAPPPGATALALHDITWHENLPLPMVAALWEYPGHMSNEDLFTPVLPETRAQPYRWQETTGSVIPLWGDDFVYSRARTGQHWMAASRVELLGALLSGTQAADPCRGHIFFLLSWPKVSETIGTALTRAGAMGLLSHRLESGDIQALASFIFALGELSAMQFTLEGHGEEIFVQGYLDRPIATTQGSALP